MKKLLVLLAAAASFSATAAPQHADNPPPPKDSWECRAPAKNRNAEPPRKGRARRPDFGNCNAAKNALRPNHARPKDAPRHAPQPQEHRPDAPKPNGAPRPADAPRPDAPQR